MESDCPLSKLIPTAEEDPENKFSSLMAEIRRPLHKKLSGEWGVAVHIRDVHGKTVLGLAWGIKYKIGMSESSDINELGGDSSDSSSNNSTSSATSDDSIPGPTSGEFNPETSESRKGPGTPIPDNINNDIHEQRAQQFKVHAHGQFCEDGGDILEGKLDDYSGSFSSDSSMFFGGRCRSKCRQRKRCKFYTIYSSGWCQLSTRCGKLRATGDRMATTFRKVEDGESWEEL